MSGLSSIHVCIAITGAKGSGKSTFAKELYMRFEANSVYKVHIRGFATPIKEEVLDVLVRALGIDSNYDVERVFSAYIKQNYPPIRKLLQDWGDWRKQAHPSYILDKMYTRMSLLHNYSRSTRYIFIIPDLRFPEELEFLQTTFGNRLRTYTVANKNVLDNPDTHISEAHWNTLKTDATIDNSGTLMDLGKLADKEFDYIYEHILEY